MTDKNTDFHHNNSPFGFHQKKTLNIRGNLMELSTPKVMGILNLTPDSFYDGGRNNDVSSALKKAEILLMEGADIIDIGAYSSRPKAEHITPEEELSRLIPVLKAVVKTFPKAVISVDTFRANIAEAAIAEGAHIINDISAGEMDSLMFETIVRLNVPYILMHMKGTPQTMQQNTHYDNLLYEISKYLLNKVNALKEMGVKDLIIDPGFGFAKSIEHNYQLLTKLDQLKSIGAPILAGVSRKSMIYTVLDTTADEALNGTTVANTIALLKGVSILRVHDVKPAVEAVKMVEKVKFIQK